MRHRGLADDIVDDVMTDGPPAGTAIPWNLIAPSTLSRTPPPEREWIVPGWLPIGATTADYGDGGLGKTLLAQQLQASCSANVPWCGFAVMQCNSIAIYCEDDEDELHRRQINICDAFNLDMGQLSAMRWISGFGMVNTLAEDDGSGQMRRTRRVEQLIQHIDDHHARLVVLDTAADLFAGNENNRLQVRQFIAILNSIAHEKKCAVLLNAHPSRAGMGQGGDHDGGSTAWSNSVRNRWSLERPADKESDPDARFLKRRKSNYSGVGDRIDLRWQRGVLVPVEGLSGLSAMDQRQRADDTFLELLDQSNASGIRVSQSNHGTNWAPKLFAASPNRKGFAQRDFETAMARLLAEKKIEVKNFGRASRPLPGLVKIIPAEVHAEPS